MLLELLSVFDPTGIGPVFSGVSASIAVARYISDSRKLNLYAELSGKLEPNKLKKLASEGKSGADTLFEALQASALLVGPLRWKLQTRLIIVLAVILSLFGITSLDLPGQIAPQAKNIELVDFPLYIIQLVVALTQVFPHIIRPDESTFLKNTSVLQHWYYKEFVHDAVVEFNRIVETIPAFRVARGSHDIESRSLADALRPYLGVAPRPDTVARSPHVSLARRLGERGKRNLRGRSK